MAILQAEVAFCIHEYQQINIHVMCWCCLRVVYQDQRKHSWQAVGVATMCVALCSPTTVCHIGLETLKQIDARNHCHYRLFQAWQPTPRVLADIST